MRVTIGGTMDLGHVLAAHELYKPEGGDIVEAIYQTVHSYAPGTAALAKQMDMSVHVLRQKASRGNGQHVFHPQQLVRLQKETGNTSILHAMAGLLGCVASAAGPDVTGGDPVEAFMRFQAAVAELSKAAADVFLQGVTTNTARRVDWHAQQLHVACDALVATVRGKVPQAPVLGAA